MKDFEGFNTAVAGYGSFHNRAYTTNEHGPSQNERCKFPFTETISTKGDSGRSVEKPQTASYKSCISVANTAAKTPTCQELINIVRIGHPFPQFSVVLITENEITVRHNCTDGRFQRCHAHENTKHNSTMCKLNLIYQPTIEEQIKYSYGEI